MRSAPSERNPALPNVPTSKEAGLPDFQASAWNALFAPKGTPKPIIDKLSAALDKALDDEATRKRLLDLGSDIPGKDRRGGPALTTLVKSEIARWTPVIKAAGTELSCRDCAKKSVQGAARAAPFHLRDYIEAATGFAATAPALNLSTR